MTGPVAPDTRQEGSQSSHWITVHLHQETFLAHPVVTRLFVGSFLELSDGWQAGRVSIG